MNRTLQSFLAILAVSASGYGLWAYVVAVEEPPPPAPPRQVGPVPVQTRLVVPRDLVIEVDAFGSLEPRRQVTLLPEVSGRIVQVLERWRPGALVEEGELLVGIQRDLFEIEVQAAEALLAEAEAGIATAEAEQRRAERALAKARETLVVATREHERAIELGGYTSDAERDRSLRTRLGAEDAETASLSALEAAQAAHATAEARRASAQVSLARATETLARTEVRAPFRGRLRGRAPGIGTLATPQTVLGSLLDPSEMVLSARVPERDLLLIEPGMTARLVFPATPETSDGAPFLGEVVGVDPASDPTTRRGTVEIQLRADLVEHVVGSGPDNGGENGETEHVFLPAGLFTRGAIQVEELTGAIWIDRRHLCWEDGEPVAYVAGTLGAEDAVAKRRVLTLLREHGEGFLVGQGLGAGDVLVTHPLDRMGADVPIRELEARGEPAEPDRLQLLAPGGEDR